jgi:hypothetical protein
MTFHGNILKKTINLTVATTSDPANGMIGCGSRARRTAAAGGGLAKRTGGNWRWIEEIINIDRRQIGTSGSGSGARPERIGGRSGRTEADTCDAERQSSIVMLIARQ